MELKIYLILFIYLLLLLAILYTALYHLSLKSKPKNDSSQLHLPPGSTGWPVIGETLAYLSDAKKGFPEKFIFDRKKKYSTNIFKTSFLGENMVFLCCAEANKFIFSSEKKLVQSWWPKSIQTIFTNSDKTNGLEEGKRMRRILTPFVKPDALQRYIAIMDEATKQHLHEQWDRHKEIKFYPLAKKFTFLLACKLFLDIDDPGKVAKLAKAFNQVSSGFLSLPINFPGTKFRKAVKASSELRKEIEKIVIQRRADMAENKVSWAKQHDILAHLLWETYDDGQFLSDYDASSKILGLIIGAYDNTSITLCNILKFLAEIPDVYDKVLKEQTEILRSKEPGEPLNWMDTQKMRYSWNVASEVLRLLPPTPGTFREVINDFVFDGFIVPKGWKLHWNAYATHKSSEYFLEPEKFDPSRFEGNAPLTPFSYVPFGGGPRSCPGREYARIKILVFMHNVVIKYKWEKVIPDEKIISDPLLVPEFGMPIRLYPHNKQY